MHESSIPTTQTEIVIKGGLINVSFDVFFSCFMLYPTIPKTFSLYVTRIKINSLHHYL